MHDLTKPRSSPERIEGDVRSTLESLRMLLDRLGDVGDNDGALRGDMIARARYLVARLERIFGPSKPFAQCTAADIAESLAEVVEFVGRLPAGEAGPAREAGHQALRTLERAISWVEEAGSQLSGNVPWKPGAR
jgi:hypothetical protein